MATEQAAMAVLKASRPTFRHAQDKAVFAVHSAFLAAGYSLCAVGPAADSSASCKEEVGIEGWNEMEDRYAFLYCKEGQSVKKRVLVKVLAFGDSLLAVDTVDLDEDKEPFHLKIKVEDFVSGETQSKNYTEMYKNFKGLIENVNSAILEKVEGKTVISKDKEEKSKEPASSSSSNIYEGSDRVPASSDYGVIYPPIPTHSGDSDIHPGPGAGFYPTRGDRGDGSMLIGPNNPMFFRPGQPRVPGVPQGIVPGSRYDPIGPPDVPGFEPSRFIRRGRNPGNHPDLEHFQQDDDFI
ncbi:hypothetical protein LUZ60_010655 [Juncus effusus]|nr:hypothetical protein LUZ60_010655 [Juncus effusus]